MPVRVLHQRSLAAAEDAIDPGAILAGSLRVLAQDAHDAAVDEDYLHVGQRNQRAQQGPVPLGIHEPLTRRPGPRAGVVLVEEADVRIAAGLVRAVRPQIPAISRSDLAEPRGCG